MGKSEAKEDTLCAEYIKSLLEGENSNLDNEIEELKIIAGKRFFDKNLQDIFAELKGFCYKCAYKWPHNAGNPQSRICVPF